MKILLIEDNPQDQKIVTRYLQRAGFNDFFIAESGEKGLELARQQNPDVILLDTLLPGIDGFETCRQLKQVQKVAARVVIMTGRIDAVDAEKARQMGADDYCVKTSDCAAILEVLRKFSGAGSQPAPMPVQEQPLPGKAGIQGQVWGQEKTNEAIRALYRELEKKNEELRALDKLKSEFVSMVSHELRTPLTIITSALSQIVDGLYGPITKEQQQKMLMALRNAGLLRRIIDDLLDMSKIEAHAIKLNKTDVDLVELAREVGGSFLGLLKENGLAFELRPSQEKIMAEVDRDRIYQVLTNLLSNAIKFTEKGKIELVILSDKEEVEFRVIDTGRGIAEEDLPRVFGRFEQFGKVYKKGHEGTGLGLAISKGLVELHQGTIRLESAVGRGSTFIFRLPKKSKSEERHE